MTMMNNSSWSFDDDDIDDDDDEIISSSAQPVNPKQPHSNIIPNVVGSPEKDYRSRNNSNDDDDDDDDDDDGSDAIRTTDYATKKSPDTDTASAASLIKKSSQVATATTTTPAAKKKTSKFYDSFSDDSDSSFEGHLRALQITTEPSTANDDDDTVQLTDLWNVKTKEEDDPSNKEKELDESKDDDDDSMRSIPANGKPPAVTKAVPNRSIQQQQQQRSAGQCSSEKRSTSSIDDDDDDDDDSYKLDDSLDAENDYPGTAWKWLPPTNEYTLACSGNTISNSSSISVTYPPYRIPSSLYDCLYEHQKSGVQFMAGLHNEGIGGILGDDMGMGKTFMTLTFLGGLMRARTIRNALIVAPKSVLRSWEQESQRVLQTTVPSVSIRILSSSDTSRKQRIRCLNEALECTSRYPQLIITTYGMVRESTLDFCGRDKSSYWDYVVLDEGHTIKNPIAAISQACHSICKHKKTHRLLLSGTPIMNHLKELWAVFDWATAGQLLGDIKAFTQTFASIITAARDTHASDSMIHAGERANTALQALLKPHFLQRLKIDCLADLLPSKTELVLWTHLSVKQRFMYNSYVKEDEGVVRSILRGEKTSPLEGITWLKKLCGHPILIEQQGNKDLASLFESMDVDEIVSQSAKLELVRDLVAKLIRENHKTLLFSQSTRMLDIVQTVMRHDLVAVARIDGSTHERDRQRLVDEFNTTDRYDLLLLSTKAAGVGLTCTGASRVIVYDPSWNPAEDMQAVDRCYRIGQKKEVLVYRMIAAGTVEEKMYEKQIYKDGIRRTVFTDPTSAGGAPTIQRYFATHELRQLFVLADPGVCTVMEKVKNQNADWSGQTYVLQHRCTVGLSRHDGFYNPIDESETPLARSSPTYPVAGRSQRVLQQDQPSKPQTVVENSDANAVVDLVDTDNDEDSDDVVAISANAVVDLVDTDDDEDSDDVVAISAKMKEALVLDDNDDDDDDSDDALRVVGSAVATTGPAAVDSKIFRSNVLKAECSLPGLADKENSMHHDPSKNHLHDNNSNAATQSDSSSVLNSSNSIEIEKQQRNMALLKRYLDKLEQNNDVEDEQDRIALHRQIAQLGQSLGLLTGLPE